MLNTKRFIKLHVVYQNNPSKKATSENDFLMREVYIHRCDIIEISPCIPDDEAVLAKSYIKVSYQPGGMSVIETAEEILSLIGEGECQ